MSIAEPFTLIFVPHLHPTANRLNHAIFKRVHNPFRYSAVKSGSWPPHLYLSAGLMGCLSGSNGGLSGSSGSGVSGIGSGVSGGSSIDGLLGSGGVAIGIYLI